jgi:hypothetical protein
VLAKRVRALRRSQSGSEALGWGGKVIGGAGPVWNSYFNTIRVAVIRVAKDLSRGDVAGGGIQKRHNTIWNCIFIYTVQYINIIIIAA